jgi:hypothetical protein
VTDTEIVEIEHGTPSPDFWSRRPTDPADLWDRYHNQDQSQPEIAEDLGVSPATISRWMARANIETK